MICKVSIDITDYSMIRTRLPGHNFMLFDMFQDTYTLIFTIDCSFYPLDYWLTAGVTGQQGMLTPHGHLILPLVYSGIRVCQLNSFFFLITRLITVRNHPSISNHKTFLSRLPGRDRTRSF